MLLTIFPRTSKLVTDGAKLSTIFRKRLDTKRIIDLKMIKIFAFI